LSVFTKTTIIRKQYRLLYFELEVHMFRSENTTVVAYCRDLLLEFRLQHIWFIFYYFVNDSGQHTSFLLCVYTGA